jgi:hypothetical protein
MHDSKLEETKPRLLRRASVLFSVMSFAALSSACSSGESQVPAGSKSGGTGSVAKAQQAIAGVDGTVTVNAAGVVLNQYTALTANTAAGDTSLQVASVAALTFLGDALAKGDLLLVMQMQGATAEQVANDATWGQLTAVNGAGLYELVEVLGTSGNTISLSCALKNAYATAGQVQVIRVPQVSTLTINAGASITAPAWNGTTGGVVAIHAQSTVTLAGDIDVSALGFRGGPTDDTSASAATDIAIFGSASNADGARKGEGIAGLLAQFGRGPAVNGGGGGN